MSRPPWRRDPWRWPTMLLWGVFFWMGLQPEATYESLRQWGLVVTQRAAVNSPWLLVIGFSAYLAVFTHRRCIEAALSPMDAFGKTFQIAVIALLAFLPLRLDQVLSYRQIPVPEYRRLILFMASAKCLAWVYLLSVLVRYYFLSGPATYLRMASIFPSTYLGKGCAGTSAPSGSSAALDQNETAPKCAAGDPGESAHFVPSNDEETNEG